MPVSAIPLPKKPLTWFLAIMHIIWIIGFMWILVFLIPQRYRWIWIIIMLIEYVHWHFAKGECYLSYLEKKSEDPSYKLGDNPELTYAWVILGHLTGYTMKQLRMIHADITQLVFIFAIADQLLVSDQFIKDYTIRTIVFMFALIFTLKHVSFDSFDLIANEF